MILVRGLIIIKCAIIRGDQTIEQRTHIISECFLIGFERKHIIAVLFDDLTRDRLLTAHRINGDVSSPKSLGG